MAKPRTILIVLHILGIVFAYDKLVISNVTRADTSSTYEHHEASLSVDGNVSQEIEHCSHTNDKESNNSKAWLRIDLTKIYSIKSVKFWYRNDRGSEIGSTKRLHGYFILVSNDTTFPSEKLICYKNPMKPNLQTILENDCKRTAEFVWISQNNTLDGVCPMLEICEVQIFGCETGRFGENCTDTCNHCKNSEKCDIETGACDDSGCSKINFATPLCSECIAGKFGTDCETNCNEFCKNKTCDKIQGTCIHGCERGYTGRDCRDKCPSGTYGDKCNNSCGSCFQTSICNHVNGSCPNGCNEGVKGELCITECSYGEFGKNCIYNCTGNCLNNETCDKKHGSCSSCKSGYEGTKCEKQCQDGVYGINCSMTCGSCLNSEPCRKVDGKCKLGCNPGWHMTETCHIACSNGTYGNNCRYNCTDLCQNGKFCNKVDGSCPVCSTGNHPCNEQLTDSNSGAIAGSFCAIIVVALAAVVIIVIWHRRRIQGKEENVKEMDGFSKEDRVTDLEQGCSGEESEYYNAVNSGSKAIKITELLDIITLLEKHTGDGENLEKHTGDGENGFQLEFNSIPFGEQHGIPCTVGKLPENIPKNRFKTTYPYDHSRVVLKSTQVNDYINANYIKDVYGETVYIASQGPKQNTVDDFWHMVWQEEVYVIVMVTNLIEGTAVKCEAYWPDAILTVVKGKYNIEMLANKRYANFESHQLIITNNETKASRQILHLQYTAWPDHGTPIPLELLGFYHYVSRAMEKYPENKLLVHCSAGIGRTGTFIALDALHKQGMKEGNINIVKYVNTMRKDRMSMIQNNEQYRFLYYVLNESFRARGRVLSKVTFKKEIDGQSSTNTAVNFSRFRREFMELDAVKPVFGRNEIKFGSENIDLNMTKSVLPADRMRIILSSHVPGRSTYYNAVPLSTFTVRDSVIAAQYPVPGAAVDLIRLLIDQECSTLVSIHPLSEVLSSKEWFTQSNDTLFKYKVQVDPGVKLSENVRKSTVTVKAPTNIDWQTVRIYEVSTWNINSNLPNDCETVHDVVQNVYRDEKVDQDHKLVILSRDGATGCGVFCAVYNAIQQLQQDEEVDMYTIVRQLQSRRPEMISTWSEYMFCCEVVARYIKSESEDMNVYQDIDSKMMEENIYANA